MAFIIIPAAIAVKMSEPSVFIVCGGGTSGIILVRQLLKAGKQVELIDPQLDSAGNVMDGASKRDHSNNTNRCVKLHDYKSLWPVEALGDENKTYRYTTSQTHVGKRRITYPYKLGLGGNSNINAMIFDLGHALVFDQFWPKGWSYHFVKRYANKVNKIVNPYFQSSGGSMLNILEMVRSEAEHVNSSKCVKHPYFSTANATGLHRLQLLKLLGKLALQKLENLKVARAGVDRVVIRKGVVTRIIFSDGREYYVPSNAQVILCCGALITPSIIHKSFQSNLTALEMREWNNPRLVSEHGKVKELLGQQLLDHFILPLMCFGNWHRGWTNSLQDSKGQILSYPLNGIHGWVFLDEEGNYLSDDSSSPPVCQLVFVDGSISAGLVDNLIPPFGTSSFLTQLRTTIIHIVKIVFSWSIVRWLILSHLFGVLVCLVQPKSRGKYSFDADNNIQPDPQFLMEEYDQQVLHKAFLRAQTILDQAKQRRLVNFAEVTPGFLFRRGIRFDDFKRYCDMYGTTYFHPCGTLPMEVKDADDTILRPGIVNEQFVVKGTRNLRVVDASVFPHIPAAPIAKMCMVLGAAAADILTDQV